MVCIVALDWAWAMVLSVISKVVNVTGIIKKAINDLLDLGYAFVIKAWGLIDRKGNLRILAIFFGTTVERFVVELVAVMLESLE